jgi:para-nitrobenzyl esterase
MTIHRTLAGAFTAILCILASAALADPAPSVDAPAGVARGQADGAVNVFKGLPYALPPVGAARWTPPQPAPRWAGVRRASDFGPVCVQPTAPLVSLRMSEDCLTLNVWALKDAHKAPVIVWIHGGSFVAGSGSDRIYDGARLAQRGVIVVTINYRLGVLGYLAHPGLSAESATGVSGNYGLLDQIEALRWVKRNIAAFGGDPDNVTIAGESSGGLSVAYLMAAPPARGLFARAIAESAYLISTPALRQVQDGETPAETIGANLAAKLGAHTIADLRKWDAATLANAAARAGYAPFGTIDGQILPRQLVDVFDRGEQAPVPLLVGFNSGEIRALRFLAPKVPASAAVYEAGIRAAYGDLADVYLKLYPPTNLEESIVAASRDGIYGWTAQRLAAKQTALGQGAYLYFFDHGYPAVDSIHMHGFHGSELPYVFGTADRLPVFWPKPPGTPGETVLTDAMIGYWTSFARTGQPEAAGAARWAPYGQAQAYMAFDAAPRAADHLLPGAYALQEEVVCRRRAAGTVPWNWNIGLWSPPLPPATAGCAPAR